jgi:hypothetical protein
VKFIEKLGGGRKRIIYSTKLNFVLAF